MFFGGNQRGNPYEKFIVLPNVFGETIEHLRLSKPICGSR